MPRKPDICNRDRYYDPFPENLRNLKEEKHYNQEMLARVLGLKNRQSVTAYEDGSRVPTADAIIAIAKHFDVSADYLLGLSKNRKISGSCREAAEYTGLSENAVGELHSLSKLGIEFYMRILSAILSSNALPDFLRFCEKVIYDAEQLQNRLPEYTEGQLVDDGSKAVNEIRHAFYDASDCLREMLNGIFPFDKAVADTRARIRNSEEQLFMNGFDEGAEHGNGE